MAPLDDPPHWRSDPGDPRVVDMPCENGIAPAKMEDKLEPIAVVGIAMKFPQDAVSCESFWQMLVEGRSTASDVPPSRFNADAFCRRNGDAYRVMNARGGHFIEEDLGAFDAPFFSITAAEAECMDPQQRWLLETSYRAFENAGMPLEGVTGSKTSVHVGAFLHEYEIMLLRDPELQAKYRATGTGQSILANRLSWFYNFTGPSIMLDTACSSSLVAVHLACQSLRNGESEQALAAGCNILLNPDTMSSMSDFNFLSPDSRCYSFDARANGYARGEGIGAVVLKPLDKALQDGNVIRAVIRATGVNQDGRTPGITQPSSAAQERLIRETYASAECDIASTRYFEAHGTGTPLGDAVEALAVQHIFQTERSPEDPLIVGAVKTNIGHLEGASGIAGLIKTILVLERGLIPPNLWFEKLSPKISSKVPCLKFPQKMVPWPASGLRRASINSFGFGGTNAHAILDDVYHYLHARGLDGAHCTRENPPCYDSVSSNGMLTNGVHVPHESDDALSSPELVFFSAHDKDGIARLSSAYTEHFASLSAQRKLDLDYLRNVAFTLARHRSNLVWRSFAVVNPRQFQIEASVIQASSPVRPQRAPELCFIFTGQGAQWPTMGKGLLAFPIFKESLMRADNILRHAGCPWSISDEMSKLDDISQVHLPAYSQPLVTALQVGLVDLLRAMSIRPSVVVGHSSGEIAAAYCTGAIDQRSAMLISYYRGIVAAVIADDSKESGAMLSVNLSEGEAQTYIDEAEKVVSNGRVCIACVNSPRNVTLGGCQDSIDEIAALLKTEDIFAKRLKVNVAYHSPQMQEVASLYKGFLTHIEPGDEAMQGPGMLSSLTGKAVARNQLRKSDYWVQNMLSQVRFAQAVSQLGTQEQYQQISHFVELGPHHTLKSAVKETLSETSTLFTDISYAALLVRAKPTQHTFLHEVGSLHCMGYPVDLSLAINGRGRRTPNMIVDLPQYPFNRSRRYWREGLLSHNFRFRQHPPHRLLGTTIRDWNPLHAIWRNVIRLSDHVWVSQHQINNVIVFPAAGMLAMAIEAVDALNDGQASIVGYEIRETTFQKALVIPSDADGIETRFHLRKLDSQRKKHTSSYRFSLYAQQGEQWEECCSGLVTADIEDSPRCVGNRESIQSSNLNVNRIDQVNRASFFRMSEQQLYKTFKRIGMQYGPVFQNLTGIKVGKSKQSTACIDLKRAASKLGEAEWQSCLVHPTVLDALFQLGIPALMDWGSSAVQARMPTRISRLWIARPQASQTLQCIDAYATSVQQSLRDVESTLLAVDVDTNKLWAIGSVQSTSIQIQKEVGPAETDHQHAYYLTWKPDISLMDNSEIQARCARHATSLSAQPADILDGKTYASFLALSELVKTDMPRLSKKHHVSRYLEWAKHELFEGRLSDRGFQERCSIAIQEDPNHVNKTYEALEQLDAEGRLLVRVARNLKSVLQGDLDAVELLFSDETINDTYAKAHNVPVLFRQASYYIDAIAHKKSSLSVLEIGAGTGGATQSILEALASQAERNGFPRFSTYTFTDISPSFFEKAKERFSEYSDRMRFSALDIEQDPREQGYSLAEYDLVVASNVIHATSNLQTTLSNIRKLLKPGGKLVLHELTNVNQPTLGFIFGLLPGWWLATEKERVWGPLQTEHAWHKQLVASGFTGVDIALRDSNDENRHLGTIMISSVPKLAETCSPNKIAIIIEDDCELQIELALILSSKLNAQTTSSCEILRMSQLGNLDADLEHCVVAAQLQRPFLHDMTTGRYASVQNILSAAKYVLWLASADGKANPAEALINGFSRSMREENDELKFVTLTLTRDTCSTPTVDRVMRVFQAGLAWDKLEYEAEYMDLDNTICIGRIARSNEVDQHLCSRSMAPDPEDYKIGQDEWCSIHLSIGAPGLLESLNFVGSPPFHEPLVADEIEVEVKASGVNFKDVLTALSQVNETFLGLEGAGVVTRVGSHTDFQVGDRVAGFFENSLRTHSRCHHFRACRIPDGMDFYVASGIPIVYSTAHHALINLARLRKGQSVLIHSGAGGLGQASIQLARLHQANILTTVGSEKKRSLLIKLYGIPADHIFSSRSLAFASEVQRLTEGRGVDIVLNSLSGDGMRASLDCVAACGHFIEVGMKDISSFGTLPMDVFAKNIIFASLNLTRLIKDDKALGRQLLTEAFKIAIEVSAHRSMTWTCYGAADVETAFRSLQSGNSIGKAVIDMTRRDTIKVVPSKSSETRFDPHVSYLIAGGLGGIGRSIARWMVSRGANYLILLSRSTQLKDSGRTLLEELQSQGAKVATPPCDISVRSSLVAVIEECSRTMPPVKGCIQATMHMMNRKFSKLTLDEWNMPLQAKVHGTWNLHYLLPRDMDFFIMLSSVAGIIGAHGQSNYAAGNTYQDALADFRCQNGEKATSLALGVVESVGYTAEQDNLTELLLPKGYIPVPEAHIHGLLDYYCDPTLGILPPSKRQAIVGLATPGALEARRVDPPRWMQKPLLNHLHYVDRATHAKDEGFQPCVQIKTMLAQADSKVDVVRIICDALIAKVSRALATDVANVDSGRSLPYYGVDSLMAVEIRHWFRATINAEISVFELLENVTLMDLASMAADRSSLPKNMALSGNI